MMSAFVMIGTKRVNKYANAGTNIAVTIATAFGGTKSATAITFASAATRTGRCLGSAQADVLLFVQPSSMKKGKKVI